MNEWSNRERDKKDNIERIHFNMEWKWAKFSMIAAPECFKRILKPVVF